MLTAELTALATFSFSERPAPTIQRPDEVLIQVGAVGVCGSDIHYYRSGRIGSMVVNYPFVIGHEFSGTIAELGADVSTLAVGDRVAVDPAVSCGDCDQCRHGRRHTCRDLVFMGCPGQLDGCMSEFVTMPAACCFRVPDTLDMGDAALIEPLSIACYAVQLAGAVNGRRVAILGAGPIGLTVMVALQAAGAEEIFVSEPLEYRRRLAQAMGATETQDPYAGNGVGQWMRTVTDEFDVVFECSGEQGAINDGVRLLKPGGKLMLIGIPESEQISFAIDTLRRREVCIQNVRRQNECMQAAIDLAVARRDQLRQLLTHNLPLRHASATFAMVADYQDDVIKAILTADDSHCSR